MQARSTAPSAGPIQRLTQVPVTRALSHRRAPPPIGTGFLCPSQRAGLRISPFSRALSGRLRISALRGSVDPGKLADQRPQFAGIGRLPAGQQGFDALADIGRGSMIGHCPAGESRPIDPEAIHFRQIGVARVTPNARHQFREGVGRTFDDLGEVAVREHERFGDAELCVALLADGKD